MATTEIGPGSTGSTDAAVHEAVLEQLQSDEQTASLPIGIDVFDRIVFVHGVVPDPASVAGVAAVIERAADVAEVIDVLDVEPLEDMRPDTEEPIPRPIS
jgi:osmotically-inducible protein OsmY